LYQVVISGQIQLPDGKSEIIIVALKSDKGKPRESTGRKVNGLPTPNVRL